EQFFANQFQSKVFEEKAFIPVAIASVNANGKNLPLLDLCHHVKKEETKTAVRRLITNGAVQINNQKITDPTQLIELCTGTKIKIGKRTFIELV
ncbi:MAG TPA: S4 domain-containing protein, partial [Flavisolibacter sp.]|nr:S4 domain-containing protein [Flavisolibacter sp.]